MISRRQAGAAAALLLWTFPAAAEEGGIAPVGAVPAPVTAGRQGISGFQLIEHRSASAVTPAPSSAVTVAPVRAAPVRRLSPAARSGVLAFIRAAELRHRLPVGLLDALIAVESAYQPGAISRAGAMGLAQLMPLTARTLGVLDPFDARANIDGGARYLRAMLDRFGSVALALAAYNAGPAAVQRASGIPANGETAAYVAKVLRAWRAAVF